MTQEGGVKQDAVQNCRSLERKCERLVARHLLQLWSHRESIQPLDRNSDDAITGAGDLCADCTGTASVWNAGSDNAASRLGRLPSESRWQQPPLFSRVGQPRFSPGF